MTNSKPRRDRIAAGAAGKVDATESASPPLPDQAQCDADDLRVEHIAAQLEEAEQHLITDDWIKEQQHLDADAWHSPPSLVSFKDGEFRKITVESIHQNIGRKIAAARANEAAIEAPAQRRRRGRPRKYPPNESPI
jgi:hypothetical protein